MKTNSSFHAAGEVATQPAWGTGEQAAQPLNGSTSRFAMSESSLADLLQKAASQYPNRAAYKFIDYDTDPAGFTETVTWWQVHRRAMIVAEELWIYASSGDRVAILAPQGLEYIIAFMGVLQAGLIAVPLPVPQFGIHDERISSALRDSAPSIILTTSSVIDEVTTYAPHACAAQGQSAPIVVAVDALDLSSSRALDPTRFERPSTAYLQYTSGSTRAPAGVVLSHKNVITNCVQLMSDYIGDSEKVPSTPVSWLPFYHDMGLMLGIILPMINQDTAVLMSPMAFLQRPARWMQLLAKHRAQISSAISVSNWRYAEHPTTIWLDLTSGSADDRHRRRTSKRRDAAALHRAVRPVQPQRDGNPAVIWARGGDGVRGDRRTGTRAEECLL